MDTNQQSGTQPDYSQPVAYDNQGRPLYAHPPVTPQAVPNMQPASTNYVHITRAISPVAPVVPPEIQEKHEASKRKYPRLNLSEGEYVIRDIERHPIGLVQIWGIALLLIAALVGVLIPLLLSEGAQQYASLAAVGLGLSSLIIFGGASIASYVYKSNRFYLTNESVIQEIQISLFGKHEQTVSLENIEDASFYQTGIISHIFDYGLLRLSTEGEETTYRFNYAAHPREQIAVLNNVVEAFKDGRPMNTD